MAKIEKPIDYLEQCFKGIIIEYPQCPSCGDRLSLFKDDPDIFWCETCEKHVPWEEVEYEVWNSLGLSEKSEFLGNRIAGKADIK